MLYRLTCEVNGLGRCGNGVAAAPLPFVCIVIMLKLLELIFFARPGGGVIVPLPKDERVEEERTDGITEESPLDSPDSLEERSVLLRMEAFERRLRSLKNGILA